MSASANNTVVKLPPPVAAHIGRIDEALSDLRRCAATFFESADLIQRMIAAGYTRVALPVLDTGPGDEFDRTWRTRRRKGRSPWRR
jgi:hypothetical protein